MTSYDASFNNNTANRVRVLVRADDTYDAVSRVRGAYPEARDIQLKEVGNSTSKQGEV